MRKLLLPVLLGFAYHWLIARSTAYSLTWGGPLTSSNFWGQSSFHALTYMQLWYAIGVLLAAVPIALIIVWRYRDEWLLPASIAVIVPSALLLLAIFSNGSPGPRREFVLSIMTIASVISICLILPIVTAIFRSIVILARAVEYRDGRRADSDES